MHKNRQYILWIIISEIIFQKRKLIFRLSFDGTWKKFEDLLYLIQYLMCIAVIYQIVWKKGRQWIKNKLRRCCWKLNQCAKISARRSFLCKSVKNERTRKNLLKIQRFRIRMAITTGTVTFLTLAYTVSHSEILFQKFLSANPINHAVASQTARTACKERKRTKHNRR